MTSKTHLLNRYQYFSNINYLLKPSYLTAVLLALIFGLEGLYSIFFNIFFIHVLATSILGVAVYKMDYDIFINRDLSIIEYYFIHLE